MSPAAARTGPAVDEVVAGRGETRLGPAARAGTARPAAPGLLRLTLVELRKTVDTRAGRALLGTVLLLGVGVIALQCYGHPPRERTFGIFFEGAIAAPSVLVPVLGILMVTGEWSQRTALVTFTLVPRRGRVAAAKVLAGALLVLASVLSSLVQGALATLVVEVTIGGGGWEITGRNLLFNSLGLLVGVAGGVAFGLLFTNSPLAIVLYFLLPTIWAMLGQIVADLAGTARWLDTTITLQALAEDGAGALDLARFAVSVGVWVVVPLAGGWVRLLRREVG